MSEVNTTASPRLGGTRGHLHEMTYDEAVEVMAGVDARAQIARDLARLEEAFDVPALSPTSEQVEESVALGPKAEHKAAQLLLKHTKKKLEKDRRALSKSLIAAGVEPRRRQKIYRLQKKGPKGKAKLEALFAEIEAEKLAET